jgi:hypothetical protein
VPHRGIALLLSRFDCIGIGNTNPAIDFAGSRYAEGVFPFANQKLTDPVTGKSAGRHDRCTATNTGPVGMEVYSANAYWVKGASLFHTDTKGTVELTDHPMSRWYFISSHQHGVGNGPFVPHQAGGAASV